VALTEADIEQFIRAVHESPALRDRVRDAIIGDDFLALPGLMQDLIQHSVRVDEQLAILSERMDGLALRMDQLTERMDQLTERMDQLTLRMDQLTQRMDKLVLGQEQLTGRVGLLDGQMFEFRYERNLASRLGKHYRRVRPTQIAELHDLVAALDSGRISEAEWDDVLRLDAIAWATRRSSPDDPELLVALELSRVVDRTDIERAHRRSGILRSAGLRSEGCVDGDTIRDDAQSLAIALGVVSLVGSGVPAP
jgi:hypothetical protein